MPTGSPPSRVRFGPFELDQATGELYRDGRRIRVQEQPRQVLVALLERPGELVTREDLRKSLSKNRSLPTANSPAFARGDLARFGVATPEISLLTVSRRAAAGNLQ
jgi:hypothetical protein